MRTLIFATMTAVLIGGAAQAAPTRDPQAEFTTRSPAGYVYRRVPQPVIFTPDPDAVAPADVVVPNIRAQSRRAARQPYRNVGASSSPAGAVAVGVGVNVGSFPSANRSGH